MSKDKYSVHWDGSEECDESMMHPTPKGKTEPGLPDHILDNHHDTMMKAEAIKANPHIMKHLGPHMAKKAEQMKKVADSHAPVKSMDELKAKAKKISMK